MRKEIRDCVFFTLTIIVMLVVLGAAVNDVYPAWPGGQP